MQQRFNKIEGVEKTSFDYMKAEVTAFVNEGGPTSLQLLKECQDAGYTCVIGAGKGSYQKARAFPDGSDVVWLTKSGGEISIKGNIVPGKVTVFDFYAKWCGPCRIIDENMAKMLPEMPYVAYRKINIVDWDSPVAKQHLTQVSQLPYLVVYGKDGQKVGVVNGLKLKKLRALIKQGNES